jgi:hypothetical protein
MGKTMTGIIDITVGGQLGSQRIDSSGLCVKVYGRIMRTQLCVGA